MEHYYKITIAPPPSIYPDINGFSPEILEKLLEFYRQYEFAMLSTEHFKDGRVHYEGMIGMIKEMRIAQLKKALLILFGFPGREQISMDPDIRRRFVVIRKVGYLPGAVFYVMKEGKCDLVKKGMTDTWISEQVLEAEKNKAILVAEAMIYVNDSNFIKLVTKFINESTYSWNEMDDALVEMHRTHCFARVRNGKSLYASLALINNNDRSHAHACVMNWKAGMFQ